jgi:hypothetical protein
MKAGDELALSMEGYHVANAVIEEINGTEATIFIPATRIVMGVAHSLTDLEPKGDSASTIITDAPSLQGASGGPEGVSAPQKAPQEAPAQKPGTDANKEIEEAYRASGSLSEMNLDSSAIDD